MDRNTETKSVIYAGGVSSVNALDQANDTEWLTASSLCIVVMGASGDLAKKKTYPSLLDLYDDNLLPMQVQIFGLARTAMSDDELRDRLRPFLQKSGDHCELVVERFLKRCFYHAASSYGDVSAYHDLSIKMETFEATALADPSIRHANRLFYFAIPPSVFAETGHAIKETCMQEDARGWTRLIVEKPFGRDLESFEQLNKTMSEHFTEDHLYRIDHYLGKELVQNLQVLRFSNTWFERVWNAQCIQCVILTFKEPFGTEGRGGYFDQYGIIRDVCQNHLLQVLTLLAMETPTVVEGPLAGKAVRDAKVAVLNAMDIITIDDVVLGQYEGYVDDPTITNKNSNCPTFCTILLKINTPRWHGVPFIMKAGKALNERKAEVRVQFKDTPASEFIFQGTTCPRNELVMRIQPHEAIYLKSNVKSPGFAAKPIQAELEMNYDSRFFDQHKESNPDAYTRLILDVLQHRQSAFVRDDELRRAWEIFTPVLHAIEKNSIRPVVYKQGSRGPGESDDFITKRAGYSRNEDYIFYQPNVARKTEGTNEAPRPLNQAISSGLNEEELCDVGVFGLSIVGTNIAFNLASHGFRVAVGNRTIHRVTKVVDRSKAEGFSGIYGAESPSDFVEHLKKPRKVFIFVQAGKPVDDVISTLARFMEEGDVVVDGGDEWFRNSFRRTRFLTPRGIHFIGMGVSGGEKQLRVGPSIMAGGSKLGYDIVEPFLNKIVAQVDGIGPCNAFIGADGAGYFVKMVHNGMEYGDMQLIAEVYDVMKCILRLDNEEIADVFQEWNKAELSSYLLMISSHILRVKDRETGVGYLIDYILDKAGMKGTGMWAIQEAAENYTAIPTISAALAARMMSSITEERAEAAAIFEPKPETTSIEKDQVLGDLRAALYASRIALYAQGFNFIKVASKEYKWDVNLSECARVWTGGSVICSRLMVKIYHALTEGDDVSNLMMIPCLTKDIIDRLGSWRRLVSSTILSGIPCPALCDSLTYFDSLRRARLPSNLIQAQRDFFGSHTYERLDKKGHYHTVWTDYHGEIEDTSERISGEILQTDIMSSPLERDK